MLMVVFGAGASYDSAPSLPLGVRPYEFRPPLADELFDDRPSFSDLAQKYARMLPIVPFLRERGGRSVEQTLERLKAESERYPDRVKQLLAVQFYLREVLLRCGSEWKQQSKGVTNYCTLLAEIAKYQQRVLIVTFNYDLLLEDALSAPPHSFKPARIPDYVSSHPMFTVIKIHGSVNWWRIVNPSFGPMSPAELIEEGRLQRPSDLFAMDISSQNSGQGFAYLPAIAIPLVTKDEFECPPDHLQKLQDTLPKVTKILFIGWQGKDDKFLDLLSRFTPSLRQCMFVSGTEAEAKKVAGNVMAKFGERAKGITTVPATGGFSDFIQKSLVDRFIESAS